MSLQKLIGHIEGVRLLIVDKVTEVLIDLASYDYIEVVYLLRHEVAELFVHFAALEVVLLESDASIHAFQ